MCLPMTHIPWVYPIGLLRQTITWYMLVGKLLFPHWDIKTNWTSEAWLAFVLISQCGNNNELAHWHVPSDRLLQKASYSWVRLFRSSFPFLQFHLKGGDFLAQHFCKFIMERNRPYLPLISKLIKEKKSTSYHWPCLTARTLEPCQSPNGCVC